MQLIQQNVQQNAPYATIDTGATLDNDDGAAIEKLVNQSLLGDWMIEIQHISVDAKSQDDWQKWGTTFFAIKSPAAVLEAIITCRASHPTHAIRLYAEKFRPATRMTYQINQFPDDGEQAMQTDQAKMPASAANQDWTPALVARKRSNHNRAWQYLAAIGTLTGSIFLLEQGLG